MDTCDNLPNLNWFSCNNNLLTGNIPEYFISKSFQRLWFSDNFLTGNLPHFKLQSLTTLSLSNNNFSGCIPPNYCDIPQIYLSKNPQLPYTGNIDDFCSNGRISEAAMCDDGLDITNLDYINNCKCVGILVDTCYVTVYDTVQVTDTLFVNVFDTIVTTITETISVTDTLIINLNIPNSSNQTVENRVLVYPNPASSHMYIDMGDHTLLENYDLQILNALGQPVYFTTIDKNLYYIDLNTWTGKGVYFVRIKNPSGITIQTKKIILQ